MATLEPPPPPPEPRRAPMQLKATLHPQQRIVTLVARRPLDVQPMVTDLPWALVKHLAAQILAHEAQQELGGSPSSPLVRGN